MNREALVLYLQQIRNLEVTKVCLTDKFQQVSKSMKEEIQRCQEKSFPEKEDNKEELTIPIILILIALGIFAVSLSNCSINLHIKSCQIIYEICSSNSSPTVLLT